MSSDPWKVIFLERQPDGREHVAKQKWFDGRAAAEDEAYAWRLSGRFAIVEQCGRAMHWEDGRQYLGRRLEDEHDQ